MNDSATASAATEPRFAQFWRCALQVNPFSYSRQHGGQALKGRAAFTQRKEMYEF